MAPDAATSINDLGAQQPLGRMSYMWVLPCEKKPKISREALATVWRTNTNLTSPFNSFTTVSATDTYRFYFV